MLSACWWCAASRCWGWKSAARGKERYARVGSGAARMPFKRKLGRFTLPCLLLPALLSVLALGVPLLTLGRWLVAGGAASGAR
jgi:iron(III) transport system permease protein